jgi:gluconokinase
MRTTALRSPYHKVGGLVFFGHLLDKIRLKAENRLPVEWGTGVAVAADGRCARFLHVTYELLEERTLEGGSDDEVLEWCFQYGRRPNNEEIQVWNAFMSKRGWRDDASDTLEQAKSGAGLGHRADIQTYFDLLDAPELRDSNRISSNAL